MLDRNARARLLFQAEALDRRTHQPGRHGGMLKRTGLAVLKALLFGFHNIATGRCDPSLDALARMAGCARSTVAEAPPPTTLNNLKAQKPGQPATGYRPCSAPSNGASAGSAWGGPRVRPRTRSGYPRAGAGATRHRGEERPGAQRCHGASRWAPWDGLGDEAKSGLQPASDGAVPGRAVEGVDRAIEPRSSTSAGTPSPVRPGP